MKAARRHRGPTTRRETADAYRTVAARLAGDPAGTLHSTAMTPEREAILDTACELLGRCSTDVLIAWLPVLGKHAGGRDSEHERPAARLGLTLVGNAPERPA